MPSAAENLPAPVADKLPRLPETKEELQETKEAAKSGLLSQLRALAAGGFGGICAVVVGHPFDLVKVRLQTAERGVYSSAVDVVRKSVARDGLRRGLYAGVSAPLVGVTPMFAVSFWGYDLGKQIVSATSTVGPDGLSIGQISTAGFLSAVPMTAITAPFERVKVILQVQGQKQLAPGEKPKYNGGLDVVRQLYREGGVRSVFRGSAATPARDGAGARKSVARDGLRRGLYAGVSAPLVGVTPMFAVSFWGYDLGKQIVSATSTVGPDGLSIGQISTAGFLSAVPMTAITAPFERVKVILQVQGQKQLAPGEKPKYNGGLDVVRQLYREGGVRSVFRGSAATLARDGPGSAAYFAAYEYIKRALSPKDALTGRPTGELSLTAITCAGAAAGVAMWIPVFPVDTVKSRLQTAEGNVTLGGVIRELYGKGGFKAFFPGFGPALARAVPANAATFLGVELAHQAMRKAFD
ncbi:hypothetical protein MAC_08076 [Metarhizium acridum CQMa 102]|uniref:Carnitine/acyl carnitine carrier n=1 Tax=Metarhizium acridum (strain CQMa 102) TaxID=655827 RepID=E9EDX8_METAQ|nr:uncharacterized protein MAC_08076 [Metarhizium acridum CQMa 102]EFY85870.1 hypothetical protein MAC_08076 [Metarhizium acridum CQMa 102]